MSPPLLLSPLPLLLLLLLVVEMSDSVFRPRRRPVLRLVVVSVISASLIFAGGMVVWLRVNVVPPDCSDPATLALVRQSLVGHFKVPPSVMIADIETHAGGYVAFRFACEADLHNIDPKDLPPGTPIPGSVYYISRLTPDHQRHEVEVSIYPLLKLEKVQ